MDRHTKEQRRNNMRAVKAKDSKIETSFAKALFAKGYRYRKNNRKVFGCPDLTFNQIRLAIFIDSEFWHGKDWEIRKEDHKSNREFWQNKIEGNIERDRKVEKELRKLGWTVLRFWGEEIEKELDHCIQKTESIIKNLKLKLQ